MFQNSNREIKCLDIKLSNIWFVSVHQLQKKSWQITGYSIRSYLDIKSKPSGDQKKKIFKKAVSIKFWVQCEPGTKDKGKLACWWNSWYEIDIINHFTFSPNESDDYFYKWSTIISWSSQAAIPESKRHRTNEKDKEILMICMTQNCIELQTNKPRAERTKTENEGLNNHRASYVKFIMVIIF